VRPLRNCGHTGKYILLRVFNGTVNRDFLEVTFTKEFPLELVISPSTSHNNMCRQCYCTVVYTFQATRYRSTGRKHYVQNEQAISRYLKRSSLEIIFLSTFGSLRASGSRDIDKNIYHELVVYVMYDIMWVPTPCE
jgi:hypothetical protein